MKAKHLSLICAASIAATAIADVTVTSVNEKDGSPWSATYIAGGKVRTENFHGDASYVLWQTGATSMTTVIPSRKSYMVVDAAQVAAQAKQAADAMKQMESQLASLPPQMREMMKKQMPNMGSGKPLIEMKMTKTGKTMSKGGYSCQVIDFTVTGVPAAGEVGQEFCVVDPNKLGIPAGDLQTIKAMAEFTKQMTKDLGQMVGGLPDVFEMGGWPVWTRDKKTNESWVVKSVEKSVNTSFSVPAGYTQEQMGGMNGATQDPNASGKKKKKKNG
jgi:hypothetical protein